MNALAKAYEKYYQDPNPTNVRNLWDSIVNYDYTESLDTIGVLRQKFLPRPRLPSFTMYSNGSTNEIRKFKFGPHSFFWINHIEDHVKYRKSNKFVHIINGATTPDHQLTCVKMPIHRTKRDTIPIHYLAHLRFENPHAIPFLIDELKKIEEYGLSTDPNNWLCLLSSQLFRQFLESSGITSAISTSWEPFFKNPPASIHFNDNMVNWTTSMNFYTCQLGTKHFLPTFVPTKDGIVNLINLCQPALYPTDDLMTISDTVSSCGCGKNYQKFSFIPHVETAIRNHHGEIVYAPELANQLNSRYINLQFIQTEEKLDVLYILAEGELDKSLIQDYFVNHGFKVNFHCDKYFQLGSKLPVFYQSKRPTHYKNFKRNSTDRRKIRFI